MWNTCYTHTNARAFHSVVPFTEHPFLIILPFSLPTSQPSLSPSLMAFLHSHSASSFNPPPAWFDSCYHTCLCIRSHLVLFSKYIYIFIYKATTCCSAAAARCRIIPDIQTGSIIRWYYENAAREHFDCCFAQYAELCMLKLGYKSPVV